MDVFAGTPLLHAVSATPVEQLLENGADVDVRDNRYGLTALMRLAQIGKVEAMKLLIDKGCDVNLGSKKEGYTALILAAKYGKFDAGELLVRVGADIDATDQTYGNTAIMCAARGFYDELVDLLKANGANVRIKNKSGKTFDDILRTREADREEELERMWESWDRD